MRTDTRLRPLQALLSPLLLQLGAAMAIRHGIAPSRAAPARSPLRSRALSPSLVAQPLNANAGTDAEANLEAFARFQRRMAGQAASRGRGGSPLGSAVDPSVARRPTDHERFTAEWERRPGGFCSCSVFFDNRVLAGRVTFVLDSPDAAVQGLQRELRVRIAELQNIDMHVDYRKQRGGSVLLQQMASMLRESRRAQFVLLRYLERADCGGSGRLVRWYERHGFEMAQAVLPKTERVQALLDKDFMIAEMSAIRPPPLTAT